MKTNVVFLLLVLAAGQTPKAAAQSAGKFTATGNMTTSRYLHTATLLADGRVLIIGGLSRDATTGAFNTESSAELYDPRTSTFKATGRMMTSRMGHAATLLPDGRVLISGGHYSNYSPLSPAQVSAHVSAELYDPETETFSATGEMSSGRYWLSATLLNNGKVLLAGWCHTSTGSGCFPLGAELYDPGTGTVAATGNKNWQGVDTATLLPNGKVLITRGLPPDKPYASWAELYDPSTGAFTATGYATTNHSGPTGTLLMNGKVLVAGGDIGDGDGASVIAELYDPDTGAFSKTGNLTEGRHQHTVTLLPDGGVLFAGGHIVRGDSAEIYDPDKGTSSTTASMSFKRELHTATMLNDGRVLIAGGDHPLAPGGIYSSAEIYTPAVLIPAPVLLSLSGDGKGQGAILHARTAQLAAPDNPAAVGETLEIYLTGLADGSLIPPQVSIGGRMAEVLWFGNTPGYAGLNQINVRVPAGLAPGPAVPVRLTYLNRLSNAVAIGVK